MTLTNEQIQALKAAAECAQREPLELVVYHGKMCLRNKGGIVFTVLRDICFPEYSAENENYARLSEACTPDFILSLLAEREADKALIADLKEALEKSQEQSSKWLEAYHKAVSIGARYEERIADLEARTLTVKLPTQFYYVTAAETIPVFKVSQVRDALHEACSAAGFALVVGGEDAPQ